MRRVSLSRALACAAAVAALAAVAACGPGTSGEEVDLGGSTALRWGDGPYGVVLAHGASYDAASWEEEAVLMAEEGMTALAVEDIAPESIAVAVEWLQADGAAEVALVGGSAGADAILRLVAAEPELADRLVLLSPNAVVDGLGDRPTLFVASEGEPVADVSRQLAASAAGDDIELLMLPGSRHAQGILDGEHGERVTRLILDRLAEHAP